TWTAGTARYDRYCSGTLNCAAWNGDFCSQWVCSAWSESTDIDDDMSCDNWLCTTWNTTKKVCGAWTCQSWLNPAVGNNERDGYCSGVWDCTSWRDLNEAPNVTSLNFPTDYLNLSYTNIDYNFTLSDDFQNVLNCTLYMNTSGFIGQRTKTNIVYANQNITFNRSEGRYIWNIYCVDNGTTNRGGWYAPKNYTLVIDTSGPVTAFAAPVNFTNISGTSYQMQANASDSLTAVSTVFFYYRNISTDPWTFISSDSTVPYRATLDMSNLIDRNSYQVRAYANDTLGNIGPEDIVTNITIDNSGPQTTLTAPVNFTNITANNHTLQATATDTLSSISAVTFMYRRLPTDDFTLIGRDSTFPYSMFWDVTSLQEGDSYEIRAYSNDSLGNIGSNFTVSGISIVKPPMVSLLYPQPSGTVNLAPEITLTVNITDYFPISDAYVNITLPNGSVSTVVLSQDIDSNQTGIFTDLLLLGRYNMTFYANDTKGMVNSTVTSYFNRYPPDDKVLDLVATNLNYYSYGVTVLSNLSGIISLRIVPENLSIKEIIINGYRENSLSGPIYIENMTGDGQDYLRSYMIDLSYVNFTTANVTVEALGSYLFKCANFSSAANLCLDEDGYSPYLSNLTPGINYTLILNSTDPGFAETIQGQANITDSHIYQASANTNYGGTTNIIVGEQTAASRAYRGLIWFNTTYLPSGIQVKSANLSLYFYQIVTGDVTTARTHNVHRVQQSPIRPWTETGVTWNRFNGTATGTLWSSAGGDYNAVPTASQTFNSSNLSSWIVYNVTSDVNLFASNQSSNFGWLIKDSNEATLRTRRYYYSKNFATAANRPRLTIYYEDISPPSLVLDQPEDYYNTSGLPSTVLFYNVSDNIGVANCSLYLNDLLNKTNTTVYNGQRNNFTLYGLAGGAYTWNISCYDTSGLSNISGAKHFYVDTVGPVAVITAPENFTNISTDQYIVQVTATDAVAVGTVSFFYKKAPADPWTFACTDSTLPYRCTLQTSTFDEADSYQILAYANDSFGNIGDNYTVYNISIEKPPIITALSPAGSSHNLTGNLTVSAIITDFFGVSRAFANITLPSGETVLLNLSEGPGSNFTGTLTNLSLRGRYNFSIFANDTRSQGNYSNQSYFSRDAPGGRIVDVIDASSQYVNYNTSVIANSSGVLTLRVSLVNYTVKEMVIFQHDEASPRSIVIFENSTNDNELFDRGRYMIDLSFLNATTANVTALSTGYHLMKCADFNAQSLTCNDDYSFYQEGLVEGQNYTFILNATDPGFGETVQGSENISDSYIRQGAADSNFGGATNIRVGKSTAGNAIRGIIWFNLSGIPNGVQITSANLSLYFSSIVSGDALGNRTHSLHRVQQLPARPWTETGVTWNRFNGTATGTPWSSAGGDYDAQATDTQTFNNSRLNSFIVYNVTADADSFFSDQSYNFGWVLLDSDEATQNTRRDYRSSEYAVNASQRPRLDVYYEDISPPSVVLGSPLNSSYTNANTVS
ncbi:MAG: DNRLRE domain-containing protein, partial [Nanoarchaeota archaeon]|nr:DNRLRE domain-containing protein [Nanoarchaeota archaeon]